MSLIASFWTLDADRRAEIVDAFKPVQVARTQRRWIVLRQVRYEAAYPWFDYIESNAHEEAQFEYSGIALSDLDLMLSDSGESVFTLGLPESAALSQHSQASVALLDHDIASALLPRLESLELTEADVIRFYDADEKPPEWRCDPAAVVAARDQLVTWCRAVTPGRLGLLMVG